MFFIFSVCYVLIAVAMIALILLQRGPGAEAGSGFGGGASSTVFGARGSANFLTRATAVLAALFFLLSLGMGIYLTKGGGMKNNEGDLGVMLGLASQPGSVQNAQPAPDVKLESSKVVPTVPAAEKSASDVPAPTEPVKK